MRALAMMVFLSLGHVAALRSVGAQSAEKLRALGIPAGEWKGQVRYEGTTEVFFWSTVVQFRLGGEVLSIEGRGGPATDTSRVTRRVLADVWRDPATGQLLGSLRWIASGGVVTTATTVRSEGDTVELLAKQTDQLWWRFTINLKEHTHWRELGEVSRDGGTTWKRYFEMSLRRPH